MTKKNEEPKPKPQYKPIAEKRVLNAIKYIRLVKRMTKSANYEVEAGEVNAITTRLHDEVSEIVSAFESRTKAKEEIEPVDWTPPEPEDEVEPEGEPEGEF